MANHRERNIAGKIFDNVLFLAEVFADQADKDIPKIPVLEMARCFDLEPSRELTPRRRPPDWPLWK
jgi:hypothetical protein